MKTYRLGSGEFISAPGIVRWAINGARFEKDLPQMISIIASGWGIPNAAARKLLLCEVPYTVDGETVIFTA